MTRLSLIGLVALTGCLGVATPDIITPGSASSASGAEALRTGTIFQLNTATGGYFASIGNDDFFLKSGLLADEFGSSDSFVERNTEDRRTTALTDGTMEPSYRDLQRPRFSAEETITALRQFNPVKSEIAEMFFVEGYDETLLAEFMCNGVALSEIQNGQPIYGHPLTNDALYSLAIAAFDSALAIDDASDTVFFYRYAAQIGKARALLDRKQFAAAKAALAGVPSTYQFQIAFSPSSNGNGIWELTTNEHRYTVSDREGGNGLPFISAKDPRVPTDSNGPGFDSFTLNYSPHLYDQFTTSISLADGLEARLIAAEAELNAGNIVPWLDSLNSLRAGKGLASSDLTRSAGLAALSDPGTPAARVDLMFSERAFWLFATGHRLGDLRRLIRQYGRPAETVFPTGAYPKGGNYGTDVNFPIPQAEQNNPNFHACIDRNA
jgi:hypothetical protein